MPKSILSRRCLLAAFFVVGSLAPVSPARAADGGGFTLKDTPGAFLDILNGGKTVGRFMYGHDLTSPERRLETYKPYCHVFDSGGTFPITKGPGGSFPHHRGIYLGWNKLTAGGKTYDRWHMSGGDQVHEKFTSRTADATQASFTSLIKWEGSGAAAAPVLEEERTMTFLPGQAPAYICIDLVSKLKATAGETLLDGDPEHAGLQFRPAQDVEPRETVYVFPKAGAKPHKDLDYPWFGETFTLQGRRHSVVYLNHPENPREARISAYRDYGRFGAFFRTTIPANGSLTLRVRFLVSEGEMPSVDFIQKAWNEFAGKTESVPETTVMKAETSAPPKPKTPAPAAPAK